MFKAIEWFFKQWNEEAKLHEQFLRTLRATFEQAKRDNASAPEDLLKRIQTLLDAERHSWEDFYEIERLLVEVFDESMLTIEIGRRLVDAQRILYADEYAYYEQEFPTIRQNQSAEEKRAFLSRMLHDLQWRYTVNFIKRLHAGVIRSITALTFILSTLPFFLILSYVSTTNNFYSLYVAIAVGCWGASFSMLMNLKDRLTHSGLDDLRILRSVGFVLSRLIIGVGAALILYFFLRAELLQGHLFPALESSTGFDKNFALLVIWSFIAGFSETFVPGLLAQTEQKTNQ